MKAKLYEYSNGQGGRWFSDNHIHDYEGRGCWEIEVEIPDVFEPYFNDVGNICLKYDGFPYFITECLAKNTEFPKLRFCMPGGKEKCYALKVLSRTEKSTALYI